MTTALLDGDIIAYRAASVLGQNGWDPEGPKAPLSEGEAIATAHLTVANWSDAVKATKTIICLTGSLNFRKNILSTYKAHRKAKEPPETLAAVKASLLELPHAHLEPGLEADDLIGIMMTNGRHKNPVAVSVDKDMKTIPGRHYNPVTGGWWTSSVAHADYLWLTQTLTGDATDGYTGIPKCGPKGALAILGDPSGSNNLPTMWANVLTAFRAKGLTEEFALQQARVARILRHSDFNSQTKEVLLWHPTTPQPYRLSSLAAWLPPAPAPAGASPPTSPSAAPTTTPQR